MGSIGVPEVVVIPSVFLLVIGIPVGSMSTLRQPYRRPRIARSNWATGWGSAITSIDDAMLGSGAKLAPEARQIHRQVGRGQQIDCTMRAE